jgi:hypothetical protein
MRVGRLVVPVFGLVLSTSAARADEQDPHARSARAAVGLQAGPIEGSTFAEASFPASPSWSVGARGAFGPGVGVNSDLTCFDLRAGPHLGTEMFARARTPLGRHVDLWGTAGAGLAVRWTHFTDCAKSAIYADTGALFGAAVGLDIFLTSHVSLAPGLRVQYTTIGEHLSNGAKVPIGSFAPVLITFAVAWNAAQ